MSYQRIAAQPIPSHSQRVRECAIKIEGNAVVRSASQRSGSYTSVKFIGDAHFQLT